MKSNDHRELWRGMALAMFRLDGDRNSEHTMKKAPRKRDAF
ncbi:hypothetical protein [Paraburkholderia saeva]|nr:hypothetical protein [Paraburkholderia saeva]